MRLPDNPSLPVELAPLVRQLDTLHRQIAQQVNQLSEGRLYARYNATTAAPTTGAHARGDFVPNSEPAVAGVAGSQYVITGWTCVTAGEPGTWVECRTLTGT